MSVHNLKSLFNPTRVAVVGAGRDPSQLGHIVLRNLVDGGFDGVVYPINPGRESISGIQAYPSIAETPARPDLAIVCTPAATVPDVIRLCGEQGVPAVAVLSAGFREAGAEGAALEQLVREEQARHEGMRILGPNCLGLIVPRIRLNASFAKTMPIDGHIAFASQSGALATSVIDWAAAQKIGFSQVVSVGNMLDVDLGDLIDYLAQDAHTRAIFLYIEAVTQPRKFMSAARAFSRTKPIIVYKAGRFTASAQAAVSHTGAMVGEDAVYDAALRRAGAVRVGRIEEVFATAELLAKEHPIFRARLAVVTNAGGPGVMAADALLARDGELAELEPATIKVLDETLPAAWSHGNPVDVLGDAPAKRYGEAVKVVLADEQVDAVLTILTPQAMTDATATAEAVLAARRGSTKPVLGAWMGGLTVSEGLERLSVGGIAAYSYPEQAVGALMDLVSYGRNLEILHETPRSLPVGFAIDRARAKELMTAVLAEGSGVLSETSSKALLDAYEIPFTRPFPAPTVADAVAVAEQIGYPVVLKIRSPDITHKTDVGGVELGLGDAAAVRKGFERLVARVHEKRPEAEIQGVTVQQMARKSGYELVLGARKDAIFGAVILLGSGGVATEVMRDQALELPPLNERLALNMLQSLRIWPLLDGHRGRPAVNLDALLEVVMRFSYLVADYPELSEIEINPLLVSTEGAIALDARAVVDQSMVGRQVPAFSHLAIRPYPEEYTREATTTGGLQVTLRPIRPEDEPEWHDMLDACSAETISLRFSAMVRHTHEFASRFCFIDYDRELAIVAEIESEDGTTKLAGIGRLVADAARGRAEYAVLVADPWQHSGLGNLLTAYCLEVAPQWGASWGLHQVCGETATENANMIATFEGAGFKLTRRTDEGIVFAERELKKS
jgi:acetyltransferase